MILFATLLSSSTSFAFANWGTGLYGATNCNQPYEPAPQSYAASDELANIRSQLSRDNSVITQRQADLDRLGSRLTSARDRVAKVVSPQGLIAIDEHYNQRRDRNAYRFECGSAAGDANLAPIPQGFCEPDRSTTPPTFLNMWERVAHKEVAGRVNDVICQYRIPISDVAVPDHDRDTCTAGLADYYATLDERTRLTQEIADLRARVRGYESSIGRINTEVAEGRYCATCNAERRGYSVNSTGDQATNLIVPLLAIGLKLIAGRQQQQRPPAFAPYGYGAPPVIAGGRVPMQAYPARPYAAPIRGYNGVYNGVYGAVPGTIGSGAFACNNTSPLAFSDPMFGNDIAPIFDGPSPINAPLAAPFMNPGAQNRMFNPGFGPGFMPRMGGNAPLTAPFIRGRPGNFPGALNWANRLPTTQMPSRFGVPPLNGVRPPGVGFGFGNGFGYGNAPLTAPYRNGVAFPSGLPGTAFQYGGVGAFPNYPGNSYFGAFNSLANNVQVLGGGAYFGGTPPLVAPYIGGGTTSYLGGGLPLVGTAPVITTGGGAPIVVSPGLGSSPGPRPAPVTVAPAAPAPIPLPAPAPAPTGPGVVTPVKKK